MEQQIDLLSDDEFNIHLPRRRALLPIWIKIFLWIFWVVGGFAVIAFIIALFGYNFEISLYGLSADTPLSLTGILLFTVFLLKGFTAFGLWMEKDWAINLGLVDAILGIAICGWLMLGAPFFGQGFVLNLRLELVALIPYLLWLRKIRKSWDESGVISKS